MPLSNVLGTISIIKHTNSTTFSVLPFTFITISKELTTLSFRFNPYVRSPSILHVVLPIAIVFLATGEPLHSTIPRFFIVVECTIVEILGWVSHFTLTMFISSREVSLVEGSTLEYHLTLTMPQTI